MKGYHIKLIRHGKTHAYESNSYIGLTDFPLCREGIKELRDKQDKYEYEGVQKIYTSPLMRCKQTGEILFPDTYTQCLPFFSEMDFGDFEGKTTDELKDDKAYAEWLKGGLDNAPPNGETARSVIERCFEGFSYVIDDMMTNGFTNVAIVTHAGIIMNSLACFGLPKKKPIEFSTSFGEGFEVLVTADMWQRSNAFEILGTYPYREIIDQDEEEKTE